MSRSRKGLLAFAGEIGFRFTLLPGLNGSVDDWEDPEGADEFRGSEGNNRYSAPVVTSMIAAMANSVEASKMYTYRLRNFLLVEVDDSLHPEISNPHP